MFRQKLSGLFSFGHSGKSRTPATNAAPEQNVSESVKTATIAPNTPQTEMDTAGFTDGNGSYTHPPQTSTISFVEVGSKD